jgi:hypothetical protein
MFHKMLENSWVAEQLAVSQEGLIIMELVQYERSVHNVSVILQPITEPTFYEPINGHFHLSHK